jgi:dipeptidase E
MRILALVLVLVLAALAPAQEPPKRRLFALGGWKTAKDGLPLMRYFLGLTGKPNPKVCVLPTASGDAAESIVAHYDILNQLDCRPRHLRLFQPSKVDDFEAYLMDMDAIYVSGGNTLNMLAVWRDQGIDKVLRKAWEKGIVLGGASAGMICWFQQGCSDSRPGRLGPVDGLGWLAGSACPHYDLEKRRGAYQDLVLAGALPDGIALEDGVGALFEGISLARVVSANPKAKAWAVRRRGGAVDATPLPTEPIGP